MKLKYQFYFAQFGTTYAGVTTGDDKDRFPGMLQVNEVGHDIVTMMADDVTRDEIVDRLLEIYEIDRLTAERSVDQVVDYLAEQGVVE